ncbi:flagellar biosynthetic protein FliO [Rhabdochlamydiaceae symbiont of Dictyostelium giganteum]|uniref:flagellar biosynthetic protein FliO n=1 Tax=Rhabdochlamydiaceae symbiont of Dictyostelium giganteum TaxID=3342349 RepID=UPI0038507570
MTQFNPLLFIIADALSSPVEIAPLPELPSYEWAFVKMLFTLILLIGSLIAVVAFLKRVAPGRFNGTLDSSSLKLLEKKALSSKTMLYLLDIEGKQVLIAESQLEVKVISQLNAEVHSTQES